MKKIGILIAGLLFACLSTFGQQTYTPPTVYAANATTGLAWTAGTVNNGGHTVAITAGTGTATVSKADCSAPVFANCNFVYANSSGTVAVTTTLATAVASGDTLLAYVETDGTKITSIVYGWQASTAFTGAAQGFNIAGGGGASVNNCGTTTTCAQTPTAAKVVYGQCTASSATTCVVTGLTFTSATSYACSVTDNTTAANNALKITQASTSLTITTSSSSDVFSYICVGT